MNVNKTTHGRHPNKECVVCHMVFTPSGPNQIYCTKCVASGESKKYRNKARGLGKCNCCGEKIHRLFKWCKKDRCQQEKRLYEQQRLIENKEKLAKNLEKARKIYKGVYDFKKNKSSKVVRVCRKCKKDPYPNMFYCPQCHSSVSESMAVSEEVDLFIEEVITLN